MADDISLMQGQEDGDAAQGFGLDTKQSERNKLQPFMETIAQPDVGKRMQEGAEAVDRGLQQFNVEAQSQYDMAMRAARERVAAAQTASEGDTAQSIADRKLLADQLAMPFSVVTKAQEEAKRELVIRNLSQNQYMSMWASQNEVNATYARDYLDTVVDFFKDAPNWGNELMHWLAFDSGKAVERFGYNLTEGAAQANKAFVDFGRMFADNVGLTSASQYLGEVSKSLDRYRNLAEQFGVGRPKEDKVGALWDEFVKSVPQQAWNLMSLALLKRPMPGTLAVGAGEVAGARAAAAVNPLLAKAGEGLAGTAVMGAQIAGGSYGELRDQGVSPEIAGIAAAGNALMQAPMEKFGLESFVDIFRAKGMREAMLKAVTSIFSEGATEWAQKWPEYLAHTWALSEKHGNNVFDRANWFVSNLFDWKNIQQANDEAMLEAAVGAMWGGLGGGVRIAMTRNMQQKAREQADFLLGIRQVTQMAIDKGMPPEVVKTMLEAKQPLMASTGYVDAEAALTLYQEGNAAVLDALGVTEEELTQLADEGGAVPIQLSDLETRVDQATFDQLYQHVSIRPGSYTAAEGAQPMDANAYTRSALAEARRRANQIPGVSAELSRMYHELLDSGLSRQQARDNTTLLAVQAATLQAKGFDALSWLKRRKYVVGEDGQTYTVPVGLPQTENAELVSEDVRNQIASSTDKDALSKMYFDNQQAAEFAIDEQERDRLQAVNAMVTARLAMLNELEQRGYHGSGRRGIRQFDLRHAGEGEGGAAHGHGVYVAQAKGVANGYRIMAAGPDYTYNGRSLTELREDLNKQKDFDKLEIVDDFMLKQSAEEMDWDDYDEDAAEWFRGEVLPKLEGRGQVYEVEVPENDVLLDEQATLENQPEAVKQAVQVAVDELGIDTDGVGRDIYSAISGALGSDKQASEWLSEHGVRGITYVGERDGRAFVVFSGEDVSIVGTMFQGDGPAPDAEAVGGPELYQVQNLPEWKERLRAWGENNSIEKGKIEAFISGIEGQMKLIESLQTKDGLNLSDAIMREVVGAGQANRKKKSGGVAYSGPVRSNADEIYLISFDASSMCVKRLSAAKTAQEAQKVLGRPLTVDEQLALIALYRAEGKEAPCIYCYVESNRRKATQAVGVARDILSGTIDLPGRWGKQRKEKAQAAIDEFKAAGLTREEVIADYVLDPAVGNTEEALAAKSKHPAIYDFMNSEALATKQNQVKLYEEYSGNLLDMTPEQVEMLNGYAGIRFFSSSDFQIEHMVDLMQAFTDMAAMGAKSHAYTKVPLYVDIFGDTGQKINLSCFAEEDPETGEIRPDVAQGWDWEKAKEMRAAHPDCGVVLVASSDKILRWAMQQDWIDYIIPFHYSGLEKKYYETLGWQDFTSIQMETKIKGFKKKKEQRGEENELIGKNVGWPKVYELEREKTTAEASVEYAQMCFDRQTYPVKVEYVFTDLANDASLKSNKRRDLARERWAAMVESKKFDASQINPEYFRERLTAGKTTKDKPMRPNGIKRVRMHEVTNPTNEKDIKGISDEQGTRTYLEICKERGLYPVFPNFCFKEEVFDELHAKYADELSKAKTKEDKAKVIAKRRREEIKLAKDLWKEMVLNDSIDWGKIDFHAFKFKKDYARTDTDFNVVDPSKIHMDKAAEPLQETISQGLNEKYQSDSSIVQKLVTLARWGEQHKKPIGQPALAAARAKKDPMSAIMGGPAYPTAYKMPNRTEGVTLNQSAVDEEAERLDAEYMDAVNSGDMAKASAMVETRAKEMGFENAIPEQSASYHIRTKPAPRKTRKAYKVFYVNPQTGAPTALFVGGAESLPVGVWLDANDQWHFKADNGKEYVPSTKNPNRTDLSGKKKNSTTGASVPIPEDPAVRQYLLEHGFITEKAKSVTALAYRPGWHAGTLPFFPQGGKKQAGSNYGNVHEHNQIVFEIEIAADKDWTDFARSQEKAQTKAGTVNNRNADLQQLPTDGFYTYTTNPILDPKEGAWVISDSIKIVRALSQEECDKILKESGKAPQEWEQGQLNLEEYSLDDEERSDAARKTLAPVTYDEKGNVIPLSRRFDRSNPSVLYQSQIDLINDLFQRAWHGTPHRFDKFTLDHIGTGEGAQAHGWGLYFAKSREVGESYRRKLIEKALSYLVNGKKLEKSELENIFEPEDLEKIIDLAEEAMYDEGTTSGQTDVDIVSYMQNEVNDVDEHITETVPNLKDRGWDEKKIDEYVARQLKVKKERQKLLDKVKSAGLSVSINKDEGQLFEVEIPNNDVLLDEQKRMKEQPEVVQKAAAKLWREALGYEEDLSNPNAMFYAYDGRRFYRELADTLGSPEAASLALKEQGVLGISYEGGIDGRCFVIWDDESIQVYNTLYEAKKSATQSNPRGSYTRTVQGEDLIRIFQGHDASTVPHESAHAYHQLLEDMAADDGIAARQSCIDALVQTGMIPGVAEQYANIPVEEMGQFVAELQSQVVRFDESMNVEGADKEAIANDKKTILTQIDALTQLQRHHVAVEQARQDLKTIREWAGVPVEGTLTREQYIQVQEQFARGFEGYLATGKAPTTALAGVFARFKQWLLAIYKNIRDYVGADITPEIKDVYDRMLATEEEMQADEVAQTMLGEMPDAIAMLGCNASDYAFLEDLLTRAHMAASSRVDKERAKDRRKRYKAAYEMALTSLMEQPLWRLATGGYGRINYESLQEYLNKQEANELRKRLPKVIVSGDGSSLDVIAMGFDDEMLSREFGGNADDIAQMLYEHIVLNGEKLQDEARALANQALESQDAEYTVEDGLLAGDEYGDFLDALEDEAAKMQRRASAKGKKKAEARVAAEEQKAEEAQAEAEARAKAKAEREAKLAGVRAERKALWAEYQRRAKEELDATPVGQIDPKRYAAMLRKALKGKDNAILSRDPDKAVEAVRKARYAYALMREAKRRRDMVERNLSMVEKLCRRKPGDIAPIPATALARLLQTYGFRVPKRWGGDPAHENDSMQALASACIAEAQGEDTVEVTPDLAEWVMQEAVPDYAQDASWQSLTWADYNDLMDVFNFFVHASKEQNQNSKDSMKARVEFLVEQAVQSMQGMETLTSAPKGSWRRAWQNVSRRIFGAIQALQWQFRKADGFKNAGPKGEAGALESLVMRPILEGENEFRARMKELSKLLAEPLERLRQTGLRLQTEYGNKNGELIKLNAKLPDDLARSEGRSSWTTDQVIALALNCGNEGNRQRITGGYPDLGYDTLAAIVGSDLAAQICQDNDIAVPEDAVYQSGIFTADDWAAVQQIWDAIETLWEPTVKVHREMYGFAPRRVDVTPMTFRAQGVEVALRGGYYPIYYDKDISLEAQQWGERDDIMSTTESFFPAPSAKRGHTKSRQKKTKHPLRLSTSTLMDHVQDALKLICFGEAVRFADRVTKHPVFAAEYTRIFGQEDYKAIRPNLKGVVRSEPAPKDAMIKLANATRKYLVSAGLWGNLKVAILQTTALGPAMGDLGAVPVWQAMGRIATGGWGFVREIQQASPYMMSRWRAFDQDLLDKAQSLDINKRPRTVKIGNREISWEDVVNAGMTPLCLVDLVTSGAIWQAAYSKYMKSKGLPGSLNQGAQFHAEAVQFADEEVKKSNPDFDASSRSAFLRAQNSYRLFNAFGSAVTLMAQRGEYMWEAMKHERITKAQYARWEAYEMLAPAVAMTLIMAFARGIVGGGDDDGEKLAALFFESLLDQYSMKVPFFGSIIEGTIESAAGISNSGRQPTMRTVVDTPINLFYRLPTAAVKAWDGDDEAKKKLSYAIGDIVSFILRVPASKLVRNAERGYDQWERGEGTPLSMAMPAPGK